MDNTMNRAMEHVSFLARYLSKRDIQVVISVILMDLGFLPKGAGYQYLKTAILLFYEDPNQPFIYGLYFDVARKYGRYGSWMQVERAMRRVIKATWEKRDAATWSLYFPSCVPTGKHGYTTSTFVSGIAEILRVWEGCCEQENVLSEEVDENETAE